MDKCRIFCIERKVIDRIDGDNCAWEEKPMESLASEGQFSVYFHNGFWQPMDTLRDKIKLEKLWNDGDAPGKLVMKNSFWNNRKVFITGHTGLKVVG